MRDAEKTVGNIMDKEKTIFVGSVDAEGFPNIKACLLYTSLMLTNVGDLTKLCKFATKYFTC